jgi:hypothetical protein
MDRRAAIFTLFSVVCFALYPLADKYDGSGGWHFGSEGWAFVPILLGVTYAVLALLSWLDHRGRRNLGPRPLGYDRDDPRPMAPSSRP